MINYSFIIPHKNSPSLLYRCLSSIPHREDVEIIVVDDGSSAINFPVIRRKDVKLIHIAAEESKGAGKARNIGILKSAGKWLLFADADDFYVDNFLDVLDMYVNSSSDIVYFNSFFIEDDNQYNPNLFWDMISENYLKSSKSVKDRLRLSMSTNYPWNKMFRKQFVLDSKVEFEEIPICNDAFFSNKLGFLAENIDVITDRLYCYVKNTSGITYTTRPLSHYYLEVDSIIRINRLKLSMGLISSISLPGFNKEVVIRDYGWVAAARVYFYKIIHDPTFFPVFLFHIYRKIRNYLLQHSANSSEQCNIW